MKSQHTLTSALTGLALLTSLPLSAHAQKQSETQPATEMVQTGKTAIVSTEYGKVRGTVKQGVNVFLGIPYGADTGTARFQPPGPAKPWDGILEATSYPDSIAQIGSDTAMFRSWQANPVPPMSENILGLNVWTPAADDRKRPVIVWLHGGGFASGSGSSTAYEGVNLANRGDVVVVTINHRLNAFGYLYLAGLTDDPVYADSGNVGTLDMLQALEWVRDNIESFGGNPDNVTIFGESGGGRKVSVLNAMPAAEGLFDRAIVQSGSMMDFRTPEKATEDSVEFMTVLGLEPGDIEGLLAVSAEDMVKGLRTVAADRSSDLFWGPVIDGNSLPANPFRDPDIQPNANVPMLIGSNKDELSLWVVPVTPADLSFEKLDGYVATYFPKTKGTSVVSGYRALFPEKTAREILIAIASDMRYSANAVTQAQLKAKQGKAPVWLYQFEWETPVMGGVFGTPHASEIPFAFDTLGNSESMIGDAAAAQPVADQISEAWISFARHGNPNARGLPFWPETTAENAVAMRLNMTSEVATDYFDSERSALEGAGLYPLEGPDS
jgi:para-nitrobenzyl esterase